MVGIITFFSRISRKCIPISSSIFNVVWVKVQIRVETFEMRSCYITFEVPCSLKYFKMICCVCMSYKSFQARAKDDTLHLPASNISSRDRVNRGSFALVSKGGRVYVPSNHEIVSISHPSNTQSKQLPSCGVIKSRTNSIDYLFFSSVVC